MYQFPSSTRLLPILLRISFIDYSQLNKSSLISFIRGSPSLPILFIVIIYFAMQYKILFHLTFALLPLTLILHLGPMALHAQRNYLGSLFSDVHNTKHTVFLSHIVWLPPCQNLHHKIPMLLHLFENFSDLPKTYIATLYIPDHHPNTYNA